MIPTQTQHEWAAAFEKLGFVAEDGFSRFRQNGVALEAGGDWWTLRTAAGNSSTDVLRGQLGKVGLWKLTTGHNGDGPRRVFDLPGTAFCQGESQDAFDEEEGTASPFEASLRWALDTARGSIVEGWQPPSRAEIETWIPPSGLTVQTARFVRQGTLEHGAGRLALRIPIVPVIPPDLSAARKEWLREILVDAQDRWRMVRIGITERAGVDAEVDFSGAPHSALPVVFLKGLESLRWTVRWLVESADFLVNASLACRAIEVCPTRAEPAERSP